MKLSDEIKLYILSLALLFLIVFCITVDLNFIVTLVQGNSVDWMLVLKDNWLAICMIVFMGYCASIGFHFEHRLKGDAGDSLRITKCKSENYEHLTFLATYIIPFFGFSFSETGRLVAYLILLIIIGIIFVKTDKYYANPTLAIFGYKLYRTTLSDAQHLYEDVVVITKSDLRENQKVNYKYLSNNVFFVRKITSE
ncbi:hypothetical protein BIY22_13315 [Vibrio panuliri]|uniref:Uncharacterized protein n=1 Tax=Vibrio panuliri TaxID=1381081 RepID=A0A1Q9H9V8_9VIBR|nr:anti-phage protein KwaA [Vibrio panuliri]OLQ85860.1 hypothetical protein BIY22_13315 [Vibrio panuliri]